MGFPPYVAPELLVGMGWLTYTGDWALPTQESTGEVWLLGWVLGITSKGTTWLVVPILLERTKVTFTVLLVLV